MSKANWGEHIHWIFSKALSSLWADLVLNGIGCRDMTWVIIALYGVLFCSKKYIIHIANKQQKWYICLFTSKICVCLLDPSTILFGLKLTLVAFLKLSTTVALEHGQK